MVKRDKVTLEIDFKHIQDHDSQLAERIMTDFYIMEKTIRRAVDEFVKSLNISNEASNTEVFHPHFFPRT